MERRGRLFWWWISEITEVRRALSLCIHTAERCANTAVLLADPRKHIWKQLQYGKFKIEPIHPWVQGLELHSEMRTDSQVL